MKIAHFLGTIRDPNHDGVTRVMYQMMEHYSPHFEHHYISPMIPPHKPERMHEVPAIRFPLSTDYRLSMVGKDDIAKIFGAEKPQLLHIHTPCPLGRAAVNYAIDQQIPYMITFHTHFPAYLKHYKVGFLENFVWKYLLKLQRQARAIIVPSRSIMEELAGKGFKNLVNISHGVNATQFSPRHRNQEWRRKVGAENKLIVLFVSRLVEEKNLATLRKIPQFVKNHDRIKFVIVGDGPARKKLQHEMPEAHFTGYLTGQDLLTAYASSDIFVFTSLTETFGNVTAEALASGLPCICANKGAAGDLIRNGINGYLVTGNLAEEYAQRIDELVTNAELLQSMSNHAIQTIDNLAWPLIVKEYEKLYLELGSGSQSPLPEGNRSIKSQATQ